MFFSWTKFRIKRRVRAEEVILARQQAIISQMYLLDSVITERIKELTSLVIRVDVATDVIRCIHEAERENDPARIN